MQVPCQKLCVTGLHLPQTLGLLCLTDSLETDSATADDSLDTGHFTVKTASLR